MKRRLWFYAIYWFVVISLTELVAYLLMRPLAGGRGAGPLHLALRPSPWLLFAAGTVLLAIASCFFWGRVMLKIDTLCGESRQKRRTVLWRTAVLLLLWGAGLWIMLLCPEQRWLFGILGAIGFASWIVVDFIRRSHSFRQDLLHSSRYEESEPYA